MRPALNRVENELYPWLFVAMGPAGLLVFLEALIPAVSTLRPLMLVGGLAGFVGTFGTLGALARIAFTPRTDKIPWFGALIGAAAGVVWVANAGEPVGLPWPLLVVPTIVFIVVGLLGLIRPRRRNRSGTSSSR